MDYIPCVKGKLFKLEFTKDEEWSFLRQFKIKRKKLCRKILKLSEYDMGKRAAVVESLTSREGF